MKKVSVLILIIFGSITASTQTLFDSFTDGNFTINPVWGGTTSTWQILSSSDVSGGAPNSSTLHLVSQNPTGTEYLSKAIYNWSLNQQWGIFIGRRSTPATAADQSYFWLYANEADLNSATVDGYRIAFGDNFANDLIRLEYIVNGAVSSTVITSTGTTGNGIINFGFLVRVTRSAAGLWQIFTSALPQASATGAKATDIPNAANTAVNQGTGTENSIVPANNGYIGVAALHSPVGLYAQEFDQIYFTASPVNTPVITITPSLVEGFFSLEYVPSAAQTFTVEGTDLNSDLVVDSYNTNFEASLTNTPFVPTGNIHLTPVAGLVPPTTIYVRLFSGNMGLVGDHINNTSTGAVTKNLNCIGNVLEYPPTIPSTISFGAVTNNSIVVNFTGGNGRGRLLLVKESDPVDAVPPNGNEYGPYIFGTGIPLGAGNYPVYRGAGNSTIVTGLTSGRTYHFAVFEYNYSDFTFMGYGSEHYLLPGGIADTATSFTPLPIIINYFNGAKNNGDHLLNWKVTCVSSPSVTMEMERSSDGRNYSSIYNIIATALRCNQPFNYTDAQPLTGMNYYRLKMIDADGKISYSGIVALLNATKGFDIISITPNPVVTDHFKLNVSSAQATKMDITIFDMQGRLVNRQGITLIAGYNSIPVNVANLSSGTYTIKGSMNEEQTKVMRFVKQ